MKKPARKKRQSNTLRITTLLVLFILFGIVAVVLPTTQTRKDSYGASIPFTPVPAKSNLQLEWFLFPTTSLTPGSQQPVTATIAPTVKLAPTVPFSAPPQNAVISQGAPDAATCSGYVNSGVPVPSNCDCPGVYLICPYTTSDPTDVTVGPNGCETPLAGSPPTTGKFCIDKPVVYLYPTTPTFINVAVQTNGSVVVSNPLYPQGGWQNILANPNGTLQYQGKDYSELFYETSVTTFQKPTMGITIPTNQLAEKLNTLLDQLGLVGHEKQEFITYWLPRLQALHSPYIFFSVLDPASKKAIDTLDISPKPDTMIDFIAYFKPVSTANNQTLELPPTPQRKGFVAVEWGGVIDK